MDGVDSRFDEVSLRTASMISPNIALPVFPARPISPPLYPSSEFTALRTTGESVSPSRTRAAAAASAPMLGAPPGKLV